MVRIRRIPVLPALAPLAHVSASQAWGLFACPLQVVLDREPALKALRPHAAAALLGTAAHHALAALDRARGERNGQADRATRGVAGALFDDALREVCARRDRDISARGGELSGESAEAPEDLPYYALTRARVGRLAVERYGPQWLWSAPRLAQPSGAPFEAAPSQVARSKVSGSEVPLCSHDGVLRGSADAIRLSSDGPEIEELKSGEATEERLAAWMFQVLLYAHLYHEQTGSAPCRLRIVSLQGTVHERLYSVGDAVGAARRAREALSALNASILAGASVRDLARPSADACRHCVHRPWCDAYWALRPGGDSDVDGVVQATDGWRATILDRAAAFEVDFRFLGVVPRVGERVRICGARSEGSRKTVERGSLVWSVSS